MDHREVELRAQNGENSQMFMGSQFTNANSGPMMNTFNNLDGFNGYEIEDDRALGANL